MKVFKWLTWLVTIMSIGAGIMIGSLIGSIYGSYWAWATGMIVFAVSWFGYLYVMSKSKIM